MKKVQTTRNEGNKSSPITTLTFSKLTSCEDHSNIKKFQDFHMKLMSTKRKNGPSDPSYIQLLKQLISEYGSNESLKDDPSLVHRFLEYAALVNDPIIFYEKMREKGIGKLNWHTYQAYAEAFEKEYKFDEALNTYLEGLDILKTDREKLKNELDKFELRMEKRVKGIEAFQVNSRNQKRKARDLPDISNQEPKKCAKNDKGEIYKVNKQESQANRMYFNFLFIYLEGS